MCGIIGFNGSVNAVAFLINGLKKLEYRGYDSAGIAVFNGDVTLTEKRKGRIDNLASAVKKRDDMLGSIGIGHTRWATHGAATDANAHPHKSGKFTVVHNGIIENHTQLKEKYLPLCKFESETDTETVAKLLDYNYAGSPLDAVISTVSEIEGAYALGIMFRDYKNRIYAVRKESPLIVGVGKGEMFIASDVTAILEHTREYYLLEENEIAEITKDGVTFYDLHKNEIEKELMVATWDIAAAEKGGFKHFMLKEIFEQPQSLRNTVSPRIKDGLVDFSECGLTDEKLKGYRHIYLVGCGSAMHAGIVGKYIIENLARTPVIVDIASEFRYRSPLLTAEDLVIVISQSGETADTKAALHLAKEVGCDTLAIVNVVGSTIARDAKMVMYTLAGPEISVCSTKAYMVQTAFMYLLAFKLAYVREKISREECKALVSELLEIPEKVKACTESLEQYQYVASKLMSAQSLLYIGRGLDYALSMEGSLKLKEISYIHSESYAAGELKHGTISLIEEGMPVIAVATQTELFSKMQSNIKEVKSRGAKVCMICPEGTVIEEGTVNYPVFIPAARDLLMPLVAVVPLQLIAYYTAVLRDCDVDKPRNLAKSVTVE